MSIDYFSAFIIGLLGAGHCIGMCGGITTMLTSAIPQQHNSPQFKLILSYNLGRILSYSVIGGIAGFTGSLAAKNIGMPIAGLRLLSGFFLILLGLYLGQWLMLLNKVEYLGKHLWKFLSPLSKNFIPVNSVKKALSLGALWGWLPCGLIYSTLTWSLASADGIQGALIMMSFGLGTLPALLTVSFGFISFKALITNVYFRKIMALGLIIYGIITLKFAYGMMF